MDHHWLFFLDADGWLVGPESAPFPGEARVVKAAWAALRNETPEQGRAASLLVPDHQRNRLCTPVAGRSEED
jgi:hypothetical protein